MTQPQPDPRREWRSLILDDLEKEWGNRKDEIFSITENPCGNTPCSDDMDTGGGDFHGGAEGESTDHRKIWDNTEHSGMVYFWDYYLTMTFKVATIMGLTNPTIIGAAVGTAAAQCLAYLDRILIAILTAIISIICGLPRSILEQLLV